MASLESVNLEVPDPAAAEAFYAAAFGLGGKVRANPSEAPTTGFRGFSLSLVVSQPRTPASPRTAPEAGPSEASGGHDQVDMEPRRDRDRDRARGPARQIEIR